MKNQKQGFSMIESLVAIAIMGTVTLATTQFLNRVEIFKKTTDTKIDQKLDHSINESLLIKDLRNAGPSYNLLQIKDDQKNAFFEHRSELPCVQNCSRSFTLSILPETGRSKSFYIFTSDNGQFLDDQDQSKIIGNASFNPSSAYDFVGSAPADPFSTAQQLSFSPTKLISSLAESFDVKEKALEEKILLFFTPQSFRPLNLTNTSSPFDLNRSPERYKHLVHLSEEGTESNLIDLLNQHSQTNNQENLLGNYDPRSPSSNLEVIDDLDEYFRKIPPVHGSSAMLLVKSVNVIRYYLERRDTQGNSITSTDQDNQEVFNYFVRQRLKRQSGSNFEWTTPFTLGSRVDKVVFERENINIPLSSFKIYSTESQ